MGKNEPVLENWEAYLDFLLWLNEKTIIDNYSFDYERVCKRYIRFLKSRQKQNTGLLTEKKKLHNHK